jgi:transposase-like protein
MKTKNCPSCKEDHDVMYRIQQSKGKEWLFVCKNCLLKYQQLPQYRYGGTWKGYRH